MYPFPAAKQIHTIKLLFTLYIIHMRHLQCWLLMKVHVHHFLCCLGSYKASLTLSVTCLTLKSHCLSIVSLFYWAAYHSEYVWLIICTKPYSSVSQCLMHRITRSTVNTLAASSHVQEIGFFVQFKFKSFNFKCIQIHIKIVHARRWMSWLGMCYISMINILLCVSMNTTIYTCNLFFNQSSSYSTLPVDSHVHHFCPFDTTLPTDSHVHHFWTFDTTLPTESHVHYFCEDCEFHLCVCGVYTCSQ